MTRTQYEAMNSRERADLRDRMNRQLRSASKEASRIVSEISKANPDTDIEDLVNQDADYIKAYALATEARTTIRDMVYWHNTIAAEIQAARGMRAESIVEIALAGKAEADRYENM